MEPHDQTASVLQSGGIEFAFGTGDGSHSFTWSPPASASSPDNDHQTALNDRKRRRVQVDIVKQGVALLQLGSDMTYDFSSTHAEAEKKLAGVIAERDHLRRNLDVIKDDLRDTLGRYRAIAKTLDGTQGEFDHYKKNHSHNDEFLRRLQTKLDKSYQKRQVIHNHRNQLMKTVNSMRREESKNESEQRLLREKLVEATTAQEKIRREMGEARCQFSRDLEHAQQKVGHANLQRTEAEEEFKVVKAEMDNLRDQVQVEKTNLAQEREELQKELDRATKSEMRYRDQVAQLEKDTESLRKEHKGCQVSHEKLQSDLLSALQASEEAREDLSEAQKELDESHDKYAKLVVEMRFLEEKNTAQLTQLGSERCEHLREKRETIEKRKKAEAEIKRLRDENYSLSSKLRGGTLEEELRKALEAELGN
ncbi:uncharacterized protein LY79DRAFT_407316 [Colletotrichum navitas]|uniref:Uncharacterized protein n=1 Tax=Colletotrichum navitas TaxID=681940 RepID=A0AAD8Q768_9PEZI|nr:uncharacterized protein LY79DRAFT_407316 [Colletotrichum navitas]KAK1597188.1 hypothetical protein LY79DRAFT_407316 [Colletotrichum navitas]